ncbi:MAG: proline--tRNA ligase [Methanomicrobiales archaeon]|nr:proline--tRNA ligase [Methanomicrobiales archaeon]MDI6875244.1 proline--tRNA ligase [Methanomicrobiales archaeon]
MEEETGALPQKDDFSSWYNEVLWRAEILDVRYPVKGLYVWYPYGFAIRRRVYHELRELMDRDHQEALFPLLIPFQEFMKEAEHIKGFEDEVYWVTRGGSTELDVCLALRPTSETAIYPMYALWIRSHADLPLKLYQVVNTFRYETKHTRPLIRVREITSFKEAHTVHATWEEAEEQVKRAIDLYREFYDRLCIPVVVSRRPDWDKFPGADYTIAVDTVMPDGRTLQIGTVHHLGDHFSKTFDIQYEDATGDQRHAFQTCYGISERSIAALISLHGDDRGLILPPLIAPIQVVVVPILMGRRRDDVSAAAIELEEQLRQGGIRVRRDTREIRPGAKYYHWEMRGVPLRLEIGPRDLDAGVVTAVTRLGRRTSIERSAILEGVNGIMTDLQEEIRVRARARLESRICVASDLDGAIQAVKQGMVVIHWCGSSECAELIEKDVDASILGTDLQCPIAVPQEGPCPVCGKVGLPALLARSY